MGSTEVLSPEERCGCCGKQHERRGEGDPWEGRLDGWCDDCALARCDARPGDCRGTVTTYNFQAFDRRISRRRHSEPGVTLQRSAMLRMNIAAHKLAGEPTDVEVLFDPTTRMAAFAPTDPPTRDSYKVTPCGRSGSGSPTGFNVSGLAFCDHFGVTVGASIRFDARMHDGLLIFGPLP